MSQYLVTGASGNIGACVVEELQRLGHEVIAMTRAPRKDSPCAEIVGTLENPSLASAYIARADGIIHLASARSNDPDDAIDRDILGTARLLEHWEKGPFVYMSSQTVYGPPEGPMREHSHPLRSSCWYDVAKVTSEQLVSMYADLDRCGHGISLRTALFFRASPRGSRRAQFLDELLNWILADKTFVFETEDALETAGSSFIGEADMGRAVAHALHLSQSGPYNISSGFCEWKKLVELLAAACGRRPRFEVRASGARSDHERRLSHARSFVDATRFNTMAEFSPQDKLAEIVTRFVRENRRD
jgi:nucleoside-diphosphate-sugar epimerase